MGVINSQRFRTIGANGMTGIVAPNAAILAG